MQRSRDGFPSGDPVVLFGEGTSSDGNRVLEFRSALIGATREASGAGCSTGSRVWIQPLSIAYTGLLGLPLGRQHRTADCVVWRLRSGAASCRRRSAAAASTLR